MKSTSLAATLVALAAASPALAAADATWIAASRLDNGLSPYCAGGQFATPAFNGQNDWQVTVAGTTLTMASASTHRSYTFDLETPQADGSGRAVGRDDKGRYLFLTLDPGSGARPFRLSNSIDACRYVFSPRG